MLVIQVTCPTMFQGLTVWQGVLYSLSVNLLHMPMLKPLFDLKYKRHALVKDNCCRQINEQAHVIVIHVTCSNSRNISRTIPSSGDVEGNSVT